MHHRRHECSDGQAVRKRDGEHIMTGSFDCANPDKDECKCSNKFGDARAKFSIPRSKQRRWQKTIALLAARTAIAFTAQPPA